MTSKSKKSAPTIRSYNSKKTQHRNGLHHTHVIGILAVVVIAMSAIALFGQRGSSMFHSVSDATLASTTQYYYGADRTKMTTATGVDYRYPTTIGSNAPWPQNAGNYCFIASTQALVNYDNVLNAKPIRYPTTNSQGPANGNPNYEVSGQILYDMDHNLISSGGPLAVQGSGTNRRPFTLANIAYDFGGDPRAISAGVDYEVMQSGDSAGALYHQHIYHTGATAATYAIAKALATYNKPVIVIVNHAEHAIVVAGVWASANPATNPNAQISALAVYNPWNQSWGTYLSNSYYAKVSYSNWINATNLPSVYGGTNSWYKLPYSRNNNIDPDPSIGIYQAGTGTSNPTAHHWITNWVTIQYDGHSTSADTAYNENDVAMTQP